MADFPIDAQTLKDLPQGALETLLSTARAETGAVVAFVALYRSDGSFAITTSMEEDAPWEGSSLASLARSIWLDPDLTVGKVLVSSARVEAGRMKRRQAHVASVVLSDAATSDLEWGLLSIIAPTDGKFGDEQVDRIVALSKNLAAYLSARERMIDDLMDAVDEESVKPPSAPTTPTMATSPTMPSTEQAQNPDLEDLIIESTRNDDPGLARLQADEAEAQREIHELDTEPDGEEDITSPRIRSIDEEMDMEFEDLEARVGTNGLRDVPVRTVGDEPNDEIHIIPTQPSDVSEEAEENEEVDMVDEVHERMPRQERPLEDEDDDFEVIPMSELTIQVAEPGLVEQIGDAMDAIGKSVETVALIHLKIAYDDTAAIVPTEAARMLVAQSIRECVRYDDNVSRVGENSFVVVARLRPGSPKPGAIEKRLTKAARRATGWTDSGPSFRTDHLVVDSDSIDDPEDVLLSLLHH
jgi:hypothetical protein